MVFQPKHNKNLESISYRVTLFKKVSCKKNFDDLFWWFPYISLFELYAIKITR